MIQLLILGVALLLGFILIGRWFVAAKPASIARFVKIGGAILIGAIAASLVATGRFGVAMAALAFLLPMFLRSRALLNQVKSSFGPRPGQSSGVQTDYLEMSLDHDSGDLDGRVRRGRFAGAMLSALNQGQLFDLMREMAADDPSGVPVLEAYLDRVLGPEWRDDLAGEQAEGAGEGDPLAMSEQEALDILGLRPGADEEAVKAAHRAKMKTHHPDRGGTAEDAMRINRAKDLLLGNR